MNTRTASLAAVSTRCLSTGEQAAGGARHLTTVLLAIGIVLCAAGYIQAAPPRPIDRNALVTRHNPCFRSVDSMSPLSVGNGELAFTVDVTGLQSFPKKYEEGMTVSTLSQ